MDNSPICSACYNKIEHGYLIGRDGNVNAKEHICQDCLLLLGRLLFNIGIDYEVIPPSEGSSIGYIPVYGFKEQSFKRAVDNFAKMLKVKLK